MLPPLFLVAMLWYFAPESTLSAGGVDPLLWEWLAMGNGHGGAALRLQNRVTRIFLFAC